MKRWVRRLLCWLRRHDWQLMDEHVYAQRQVRLTRAICKSCPATVSYYADEDGHVFFRDDDQLPRARLL